MIPRNMNSVEVLESAIGLIDGHQKAVDDHRQIESLIVLGEAGAMDAIELNQRLVAEISRPYG